MLSSCKPCRDIDMVTRGNIPQHRLGRFSLVNRLPEVIITRSKKHNFNFSWKCDSNMCTLLATVNEVYDVYNSTFFPVGMCLQGLE